ncbi:GDSL-type esterase/lipase family protein [Leptolyngbya boryana CZ1]|uniref:GDSL-type esterase/lipase family protein n=1 Tax=Leptolyngbya boryana CZ1 TaxID=3060204 RepID=A0AA97ANG2_LEPBY|nr:SGNH/GDSL hydrolase family protein [Leptolyngbya boryana]WNZ43989.1 GDSL-type esterase/lipase family protein [Leptolyngbya boryana CZ1]
MPSIRIEAEDYRAGASGVTYYDVTSGNSGGRYRSDNVDISATGAASNGHMVGWTENGDWLTYAVNIIQPGTYRIVARVGSLTTTPQQLGLSIAGQQQTLQFGSTGGWTTWRDIQSNVFTLSAGQQVLRADILQGGFNFDYLEFVPINTTPVPAPTYNLGNVVAARSGSNSYSGSSGIDTLSYAQSAYAIVADLSKGSAMKQLTNSAQTPFKIMPAGDSNTEGLEKFGDLGGYRHYLWRSLTGNNFNVDFVGPNTSGPVGVDTDAAGFGGYTIAKPSDDYATFLASKGRIIPGNLTDPMSSWINSYRPDMVLLMIGTNDIINQIDLPNAPNRLSNLIDQITNQSPNTQVLVASIFPLTRIDPVFTDANLRQQAINYNAQIPNIVNAKRAQGKQVSFVDMYSALDENDLLSDGVHTKSSGNQKASNAWYNAIINAASTRDTVSGIENLIGSAYDDTLIGDIANNILDGNGGNNILTGGGGRDIFVLSPNSGLNRITDFSIADDRIALSGNLRYDQLSINQGSGTQANDTLINYSGRQIALLNNIQASSLTTNLFTTV